MLFHSRRGLALEAGVLVAVFIAAWFWTWEGVGLCLFHHLTGLDCPGCGMTRAFHALSHGDFCEAVELNLLSPVLFFTFLLVLILDVVQLTTGFRPGIKLPRRVTLWSGYAALVVVLAYGIVRNIVDIP